MIGSVAAATQSPSEVSDQPSWSWDDAAGYLELPVELIQAEHAAGRFPQGLSVAGGLRFRPVDVQLHGVARSHREPHLWRVIPMRVWTGGRVP